MQVQTVIRQHDFSAPNARSTSIQYINKLRIAAIYAVITAHVTIWTTLNIEPFTFDWWLGQWIYFLCLWSIPVFVMISGALLLDDTKTETAADFYRRRFQLIGIPLVFWTVFYIVVRKVVGGEQLTIGYVIKLLVTADPYYHMWFLYMIAGLYLITPPLHNYIRHSTRKERLFVIASIFVLTIGYAQADVIFWNNHRTVFTMFIPYIAYYMCGYELRSIDPKKISSKYLVAAGALCVLYIVLFSGPLIRIEESGNQQFALEFFAPPVIIMSVTIFWIAYLRNQTPPKAGRRRAKTALEQVASTTLGIYLLHPLVLEYLRGRLGKHANEHSFLLGVLVAPLITFTACYLITSLIMNIPTLRRTIC
jgi:surface polysaccharide O-acyltransferase-like enzyme